MSIKIQYASDIGPGELVLGNRIRMCFPARVRDTLLPEADDDLIRWVRSMLHTTTLRTTAARRWVVAVINLRSATWAGTERELARRRVATFFAGEVQ